MSKRSLRAPLALLLALLALAAAAPVAAAASKLVSLDPYFGTGGVVSSGTIMSGFHRAGGLTVTAHRAILLASQGEGGVTLARFFPSGDLDSSYADGVGLLALPTLGNVRDVAAGDDESAFLLSEGTTVTRVTPSGALDESFGTSGSVEIPALDPRFASLHFWSLAVQPDGRILVAGIRFGSPRMVVVRLLADGSLDASFGDGGLATLQVGSGSSGAFQIALRPDGKIVLAGYAQGRPALARLLAGGGLDTNFAGRGWILAPQRLHGRITALSLRPQGGVIVAGPGAASRHKGSGVFLLRYGRTGALDRKFGPAALLTPLRRWATPTAVAVVRNRVFLAVTGPGDSLQAYTKRGRPLSALDSVAGIPDHQYAGVHAAQQGGKLLFTWTPEHHAGKGEIRLERFRVR